CEMTHRSRPLLLLSVSASTTILFIDFAYLSPRVFAGGQSNAGSNEKSLQTFRTIASILTSPHCLNYHSSYNSPLQNDDNHPHTINVKHKVDKKSSATLR